jgi:ATP-dependent helicase HepA
MISSTGSPDFSAVDQLVAETAAFVAQLRQELHDGRDQLLELNSCKADVAEQVIDAIRSEEQGTGIQDYVALACDAFGVEIEEHSEHSVILKPSEQMLDHGFSMVGDDGLTVTFDRDRALVREDMEFVSWEAPLVSNVMETVLGSELGNTNISTISIKALPPGTLLVECFYAITCSAPKKYQISRFLPFTPVRVLLDSNQINLTEVVKYDQLNKLCAQIRKSARPAILREIRPTLEPLLAETDEIAGVEIADLQAAAQRRVRDVVGSEIERLRALQSVNPAIRDEEINFLEDQQRHALAHIERASMEPQAIRVVIAT